MIGRRVELFMLCAASVAAGGNSRAKVGQGGASSSSSSGAIFRSVFIEKADVLVPVPENDTIFVDSPEIKATITKDIRKRIAQSLEDAERGKTERRFASFPGGSIGEGENEESPSMGPIPSHPGTPVSPDSASDSVEEGDFVTTTFLAKNPPHYSPGSPTSY